MKGPVDAPADDAFAEKLGVENLEKLRELLKTNLEQQYAGASRFKLKRALLDQLDTKHDFPLPPKMVEAEFASIWQQVQQDKEQGGLPPEDADKTEDQLQAEYRKIAERRVRLGLVLAEIGRANNVQVTDQEVNEAMLTEARRYGPQAQQVYDLFRQNPNAQAQLRRADLRGQGRRPDRRKGQGEGPEGLQGRPDEGRRPAGRLRGLVSLKSRRQTKAPDAGPGLS